MEEISSSLYQLRFAYPNISRTNRIEIIHENKNLFAHLELALFFRIVNITITDHSGSTV
jgi:hypothetical protein